MKHGDEPTPSTFRSVGPGISPSLRRVSYEVKDAHLPYPGDLALKLFPNGNGLDEGRLTAVKMANGVLKGGDRYL